MLCVVFWSGRELCVKLNSSENCVQCTLFCVCLSCELEIV